MIHAAYEYVTIEVSQSIPNELNIVVVNILAILPVITEPSISTTDFVSSEPHKVFISRAISREA
jgi:hypothetical protein